MERKRGIERLAAAACAGGAACLVRSEYERRHFVAEEYELRSKKIQEEKTFVFLSDLHDNRFGSGQKKLLKAIEDIKPDGVLIGGDMMVVKKQAKVEQTLFLTGKLAERYPVYYGNGNHENRMDRHRGIYGDSYDCLVKGLKEQGVCHLANASVKLSGGIRVSGLELGERYYGKMVGDGMEVSYIENRLGRASKEEYQILLAHSPLFRKTYAGWGADLTLAGHFHGGTIRLPGLGGVMSPQFHLFPDCCCGCLMTGDKAMIVSRGLGTHSINIRLNNFPELTVVRLKPEPSC